MMYLYNHLHELKTWKNRQTYSIPALLQWGENLEKDTGWFFLKQMNEFISNNTVQALSLGYERR